MYKNARIVYISGSMENRSYAQVKKERDRAIKKLTNVGLATCDPLRHKDTHFKGGKAKMNLAKADYDIQQILERDENDIRSSDALLVLTGDKPTSGTWFEFAYAKYKVKIPVVVIAPKLRRKMDEVGRAFEWTTGKASKVVRNIDEAVKVLEWFFAQRYESPHSNIEDLP